MTGFCISLKGCKKENKNPEEYVTETTLQSQNYILFGPLQKMFPNPWPKKPVQCLEEPQGC